MTRRDLEQCARAWQGSLDGLVGPREQAFGVGFRRFHRFQFMGRTYSQGLFKEMFLAFC